jgi:hypothetical protein
MSTNSPFYGLDNRPINNDEISDAIDLFILPHPTRDSPSPIKEAQSLRASIISLLEQIRFLMTNVEAVQEQRFNPPFGATQPTPVSIPHETNISENITSFPLEISTTNQVTNTLIVPHIIGDFLPEERGAAKLDINSMQIILLHHANQHQIQSHQGHCWSYTFPASQISLHLLSNVLIWRDTSQAFLPIPYFSFSNINESGKLINPNTAKENPINVLSSRLMPSLECI